MPIRPLCMNGGGEGVMLRGEGEGDGGEAGLGPALFTPSRSTPPPNNTQGGSLPHFLKVVDHKAARSGSKW